VWEECGRITRVEPNTTVGWLLVDILGPALADCLPMPFSDCPPDPPSGSVQPSNLSSPTTSPGGRIGVCAFRDTRLIGGVFGSALHPWQSPPPRPIPSVERNGPPLSF
jgi:hypothetical protein